MQPDKIKDFAFYSVTIIVIIIGALVLRVFMPDKYALIIALIAWSTVVVAIAGIVRQRMFNDK